MNAPPQIQATVVFMDICGSTRLYERLGDKAAQALIGRSLSMMQQRVLKNGGTVIKSIGDALLCHFPDPNTAMEAAIAIQLDFSMPLGSQRVKVHLGMHHGRVVNRGEDIFGDAVNVAARLTDLAKAGQIMTSQATVNHLSPANKMRTRRIDVMPIKGKQQRISIHQILWEQEQENVTAVIGAPGAGRQTGQTAELVLLWQNQERVLKASPGTCVIGRDTDCDVMVQTPTASRQHASIEWRLGKFVLRDQSTNGSYVSKEDENSQEIFLRHEEFPLIGSGVISLGIPRARGASALLRFRSR